MRHAHFRGALALLLFILTAALAVNTTPAGAFSNPTTTIFINEFHYDNTGADAGEFVEIAAPAGTDLTGWSIVLYNGAGGASYSTIALSGIVANQCGGYGTVSVAATGLQNGAPDGFALVDAGSGVIQFLSYEGTFTASNGPANGLSSTDVGISQSGTEPIGSSIQLQGTGTAYGDFAWVETEGAGANTSGNCNTGQTFGGVVNNPIVPTCPATLNTTVGTPVSSGVSATDSDSIVNGASIFSVSPAAAGITLTGITAAVADGGTLTATLDVDGTVAAGSYTVVIRFANNEAQTADCTVTVTVNSSTVDLIHTIQGSGAAVTGAGPFTVEAIVVADYQGTNLRGFFIQEEDTDADALTTTSEGIFVYCNVCATAVSVGDLVRVNGTTGEFFNMSQFNDGGLMITVLSSGNPLPTAATLNLPAPLAFANPDDYFEQFEGMRVTIPQTLTVTELFQLGRFGHVTLSQGGRLWNYTLNNLPSVPGYAAHLDDVNRRKIILDDDTNTQNPDPIFHPQPAGLSAANTLRGGDTITGVTGVLHWSWGGNSASPDAWRIRPVPGAAYTFTAANPRPTPPGVGGNIQVASFNVLNYFNGDGAGGGFPTPRGAETLVEFNRQRAKTIDAICDLNADIAGLMEMENDSGGAQAIQDLVNGVNAVCGGANPYTYIDTGVVGTDEIRVALIYRTGIVAPVGLFQTDGDPVHNRPPLAQTFDVVDATNPDFGARFTVVVNHFKSKGSCPVAGDPNADQLDGQSCWALLRQQQAARLLTWVNTIVVPAAGDTDVLLIGDFNAYTQEDAITTLTSGGFTNMLGAGAYSYVFNGQWGYLDHALASAGLAPQVTGAADWHINADEPSVLDYNTNFKSAGQVTSLYAADAFRSSDHDPVIIGLDLVPPTADLTVTISDTPDPVQVNGALSYALQVQNTGQATLTAFTLEFNLPAGVTFNTASPGCAEAGGVVTCLYSGSLAPAALTTFTVNVTAPATAGTLNASAAIMTSTPLDATLDNDTETTTVSTTPPVVGVPGGSGSTGSAIVRLLDGLVNGQAQIFAAPGETITWTYTLTNITGQRLTNTLVRIVYPGSIESAVATSSVGVNGVITRGSLIVTYTLGTVNAGDVITMTVRTPLPTQPESVRIDDNACVTAAEIGQQCDVSTVLFASSLPLTGETPVWWLLPALAALVLLGVLSAAGRRLLRRAK